MNDSDPSGLRRYVWCWRKGVFLDRWRYDTASGRVTRRISLPSGSEFGVMAGWVKRCIGQPVAVFKVDDRRVVVQRGKRRILCGDPSAVVRIRSRLVVRVLVVDTDAGSLAVRDWRWAESFIDPMDDRFLDMLARLIENPTVACELWDCDARPA